MPLASCDNRLLSGVRADCHALVATGAHIGLHAQSFLRALGREGSLKACLVPFLAQVDGLITSILAGNEFLATTGTGCYINAQSLPCTKLNEESGVVSRTVKAYLCRTLGGEGSLKASLVPFFAQMDSLITSIPAGNKFLATARTGCYINAQSLSSTKVKRGVCVVSREAINIPSQDPWMGRQSQSMPYAIPCPSGQSYHQYPCR